jgi:hypothetical protein
MNFDAYNNHYASGPNIPNLPDIPDIPNIPSIDAFDLYKREYEIARQGREQALNKYFILNDQLSELIKANRELTAIIKERDVALVDKDVIIKEKDAIIAANRWTPLTG